MRVGTGAHAAASSATPSTPARSEVSARQAHRRELSEVRRKTGYSAFALVGQSMVLDGAIVPEGAVAWLPAKAALEFCCANAIQ